MLMVCSDDKLFSLFINNLSSNHVLISLALSADLFNEKKLTDLISIVESNPSIINITFEYANFNQEQTGTLTTTLENNIKRSVNNIRLGNTPLFYAALHYDFILLTRSVTRALM